MTKKIKKSIKKNDTFDFKLFITVLLLLAIRYNYGIIC